MGIDILGVDILGIDIQAPTPLKFSVKLIFSSIDSKFWTDQNQISFLQAKQFDMTGPALLFEKTGFLYMRKQRRRRRS